MFCESLPDVLQLPRRARSLSWQTCKSVCNSLARVSLMTGRNRVTFREVLKTLNSTVYYPSFAWFDTAARWLNGNEQERLRQACLRERSGRRFPRAEAPMKSCSPCGTTASTHLSIVHGVQDCRLVPPGIWCAPRPPPAFARAHPLCPPASRVRPQAVSAVPRVLAA